MILKEIMIFMKIKDTSMPAKVRKFLKVYKYKSKNCQTLEEEIYLADEKYHKIEDRIEKKVSGAVMDYYGKKKMTLNNGAYTIAYGPLNSMLMHSTKEDIIRVEVFMTPSAMVFGYRGSTDFYRSEAVKRYYEDNKEKIVPERMLSSEKDALVVINAYNAFVYIDTEKGTIYTGISKDNIALFSKKYEKKKEKHVPKSGKITDYR